MPPPWYAARNRRAPRGARGLKPVEVYLPGCDAGRRAPRGARGLKQSWRVRRRAAAQSRPARGAWIETSYGPRVCRPRGVAPREGRVD